MAVQDKIAGVFTVSARPPADVADGYHVTYTPRVHWVRDASLLQANENDGPGQVIAPFEAIVRFEGETMVVRWPSFPKGLAAVQGELERDANERVRLLREWLARLSALMNEVEGRVKDLGWATRRIEKTLEDSRIGKYKAPSLLMQEGTDRVLLEPIARFAPGTEGVVDLYLMPAYDDIATLYFEDGRWNLHYLFPETATANPREAPAKPLSKESVQEVLAEMKQHAA